MKYLLKLQFSVVFLLALLTSHSYAQVNGSEMVGEIGLKGPLKGLFVKGLKNMSIDGLTSSYGYEVLDFGQKATYCQGGMTFGLSDVSIGFDFGADISTIKTFGRCEKPEDYEGGFLKIGVSGSSKSKGTKDMSLGLSVILGFDLGKFNQSLSYFRVNLTNDDLGTVGRLRESYLHLGHYFLSSSVKNVLNFNQRIGLKLLLLILGAGSDFQREQMFEELLSINKATFKQSLFSDLKGSLRDACRLTL